MNKEDPHRLEFRTTDTSKLTEKAKMLRELIHDFNYSLMSELIENNDMIALQAVSAIAANICGTLNLILTEINFDEEPSIDEFRIFLSKVFETNMITTAMSSSDVEVN